MGGKMVFLKTNLFKFILVSAFLLLLGGIIALYFKNEKEVYYLAIWSRETDNDNCSLLVFDLEVISQYSYRNSGCAYQTGRRERKNISLFHFTYQNRRTLWSLLEVAGDKIEDTKQIILPISHITSTMQWVDDEIVLFSGIQEITGQEGLFLFNVQTEHAIQVFMPDAWFYTDPQLNNSGAYMSYSQYMSYSDSMAGATNSRQCTPHYYCNQHTYLIRNMDNNEILNVRELSSKYFDFLHNPCNGKWSPGGEYFAFQIGCLDSDGLVIIDPRVNQITSVVKRHASIMAWVDETTLFFFDHQTSDYFTYDAKSDQTSRQDFLSTHGIVQGYWVNWFHFDPQDHLAVGYFLKPESNDSTALLDTTNSPAITTIIIGDTREETLFFLDVSGRIIESPIWITSQGIGIVLVDTNIDINATPDLQFIKFDMEGNILLEEKIQHDFPSARLHVALLIN
jgi:hypothetical protein